MWRRWASHPLGPALLLGAVLLYYAGYVKDDAYISFRYAANWASGRGLSFNPGEQVEGYTNFLWMALVAALLRLGVPALLGAKLLGAATALLGLHWVRGLAARLADGLPPSRRPGELDAPSSAAWLYAASPTVGLWAASGMEPTAISAAAAGAALLVLRAADHGTWRSALPAGLALALCALLRPEGHLLLIVLGLLAPRALPVAVLLLLPYHGWRLHTFGDWLPNTFLVKSGAGSLLEGLRYAGLFLLFYGHGLLLACAALRARVGGRAPRLLLALLLAFLAYLVYVGWDEMRWFRLFAPALPFLFALAAPKLPRFALIAFLLFGVIAHGTAWHLRDYLEQDRQAYFPLGDAIAARARPGDLAVFQDAGAVPFRALGVRFLDPIGLTDRTVARLYAQARWSPFRGPGSPALEQQLRAHLLGPRPRFIALVVYIPGNEQQEVRKRFPIDPEGTLRPFLDENPYSHGIPAQPSFQRDYRFSQAWRRNDGYYVVLYERRRP